MTEIEEARRRECILGRIRCPDDSCGKCGWNRAVAGRRIEAVRNGKMSTDKNGLRRLRLRDGLPRGVKSKEAKGNGKRDI